MGPKAPDKFSTPARRRRLVADASRVVVKQYYILACRRVKTFRHLTLHCLKLQCVVRCFIARKKLHSLYLQKYNKNASIVQLAYLIFKSKRLLVYLKHRKYVKTINSAALTIQCFVRQFFARLVHQQRCSERKLYLESVQTIIKHVKHWIDRHRARRVVALLKRDRTLLGIFKNEKSRLLQRLYRKHLVRKTEEMLKLQEQKRVLSKNIILSEYRKRFRRRVKSADVLKKWMRWVVLREKYMIFLKCLRASYVRRLQKIEENVAMELKKEHDRQLMEREKAISAHIDMYKELNAPELSEIVIFLEASVLRKLHTAKIVEVLLWCIRYEIISYARNVGYAIGRLVSNIVTSVNGQMRCMDEEEVTNLVIQNPSQAPDELLHSEVTIQPAHIPVDWSLPLHESQVNERVLQLSRSENCIELVIGATPLDLSIFDGVDVNELSELVCAVPTRNEYKVLLQIKEGSDEDKLQETVLLNEFSLNNVFISVTNYQATEEQDSSMVESVGGDSDANVCEDELSVSTELPTQVSRPMTTRPTTAKVRLQVRDLEAEKQAIRNKCAIKIQDWYKRYKVRSKFRKIVSEVMHSILRAIIVMQKYIRRYVAGIVVDRRRDAMCCNSDLQCWDDIVELGVLNVYMQSESADMEDNSEAYRSLCGIRECVPSKLFEVCSAEQLQSQPNMTGCNWGHEILELMDSTVDIPLGAILPNQVIARANNDTARVPTSFGNISEAEYIFGFNHFKSHTDCIKAYPPVYFKLAESGELSS